MSRSEKAILNDTLVELSALNRSLVWRNNTGQAWQGEQEDCFIGQFVKVEPGTVVLRNARRISFGLPGSGDILGTIGGFPVAVEVKKAGGRQEQTQRRFEKQWEFAGGIYVLGRDVGDIVSCVKARIEQKKPDF